MPTPSVPAYAASSLQPLFDLCQVARRPSKIPLTFRSSLTATSGVSPGRCPSAARVAASSNWLVSLAKSSWTFISCTSSRLHARPGSGPLAGAWKSSRSGRWQRFSPAVILRLRAAGPRSHSLACGASSRDRGGPVPGPPVGPGRRTDEDWVLPADRVLWPRSAAPCGRV